MKIKASEIKKGNTILLASKKYAVETFEISDIGKQGKRKCRIEAKTPGGEKIVLIRPEDYPLDIL